MSPIARYLSKMRRVLRRRGRKREEIEDLVQDAYLRLLEYCQKGVEVREPEAVLVRTVQRLSLNLDRDAHHERYSQLSADQLDLIDPGADPLEVLAGEQCLDKAKRTLDAVGPRIRDVFFMHRLQGLSYAQIAEQTGIPLSTVEKHIARAMTVLVEARRRELHQERKKDTS